VFRRVFLKLVEEKLSDDAKKVWARARERHSRYEDIFATILAKTKFNLGKMTDAQIEAMKIKAIVDFELKINKKDPSWTFSRGGLQSVADDFYLLNEHLSAAGHERLKKWSLRFGRFVLPDSEMEEIGAIEDEGLREERLVDKVQPLLEPLWSFFVALCHALQDGENDLTARDAYWMGLVDEVMGEPLFSIRSFVEFQPDAPPESSEAPPSDGPTTSA
jgi:hypothetical protein